MLNEKMVSLGMRRSVIREIFEYGKKRKAEIGEESVFDFSLGNPSFPTPAAVTAALERIIKENRYGCTATPPRRGIWRGGKLPAA